MDFIQVDHCPVCGSTDRVLTPEGMARFKKDQGFHYLKHAAQLMELSVAQLVDVINVFQCNNCHSYYCDPWLSPEIASYVFTQGAPDHIAGWGNFEHWVSSTVPNKGGQDNLKLFQCLEKKIGAISSYAELGCPFQGFLLLYRTQEQNVATRIQQFSEAIQRQTDVRWSRMMRWYYLASQCANKLIVGYHRMRAFKELIKSQHKSHSSIVATTIPKQRFLLTQDTARGWGNNCVRYGGSCRYYASKVLGANVLPFAEIIENANTQEKPFPVDLLGIFNSLDHMNDPVGVLRKGLKIARHIIIVTHHAAHAGKQHQYAFDEKFAQWLNHNLSDVVVEDISNSVIESDHRSNNYILISQKA